MIDRVIIRNFRSLSHVDASLRPLTVLIGPNDSGKSSFLAAIQIATASRESLPTDALRLQHAYHITLVTSSGGKIQRRANEGFRDSDDGALNPVSGHCVTDEVKQQDHQNGQAPYPVEYRQVSTQVKRPTRTG